MRASATRSASRERLRERAFSAQVSCLCGIMRCLHCTSSSGCTREGLEPAAMEELPADADDVARMMALLAASRSQTAAESARAESEIGSSWNELPDSESSSRLARAPRKAPRFASSDPAPPRRRPGARRRAPNRASRRRRRRRVRARAPKLPRPPRRRARQGRLEDLGPASASTHTAYALGRSTAVDAPRPPTALVKLSSGAPLPTWRSPARTCSCRRSSWA